MEQTLDHPLTGQETQIKYAGFWPRLLALILDGLILVPITLPLTYFNNTAWKSSALLIMLSLITIAYKPFFEYRYSATPGKMALDMKVVNYGFGKASLIEILLRNIFHIIFGMLSLFITLFIFAMPDFEDITGFIEYSEFASQTLAMKLYTPVSVIIYLAEMICLLADKQKRAIHDMIAKTYVIRK